MTASINQLRRARSRSGLAVFDSAVGVLTLGNGVPASADTTGATAATVTVQGGYL
jgi:hypothetical protein